MSHLINIFVEPAKVFAAQKEKPSFLAPFAVVALATDRAGYLRDLRRPLPGPPAPRTRVGTAFHAWVERHYASPTLVDLFDLDTGPDAAEAAGLATLREHFLASEWADRVPLDVEVPLQTTLAGRTVAGRIDAVFPDPDGGVTVVDWKTGSPGSPAQQQARAVQLAVYRLAFARLSGRTVDEVRAAFFYAATGTTVRPDLPTEEELGLLLADEPAQVRGSSSVGMP